MYLITTIARSASRLGLSLMALAAAPLAQAAIVNYDFNGTIDTQGVSLSGQSFSGSFSFDDALPPATGFNGEALFALQTFSLQLGGVAYSVADLSFGDAAFDAGRFIGLDAGAALFAFLPANGPFSASFAYDFGAGDSGNGSVAYTTAGNSLPEPSAAWLLAAALGALKWSARRAPQRRRPAA